MVASLTVLPFAVFAQSADPLTPEEEASLQEIREFVTATAQHYRMVAPLEVSVAAWVGSGALPQYGAAPAVYTGGTLYLNRRLLRASNRDVVIATALAYETLRAPSRAKTLAERDRERVQLVRDGHARAVDILVQVKGLSEEAALEQMYAWLLGIRRTATTSGRPAERGAESSCQTIDDLLRRFPAVRERFAGRECAPG
jgi:hypothetical protein